MSFPHQIPSLALAIGTISVLFVFEVPLFSEERDSNGISEYSKFIFCTISCILLAREWKNQKKNTGFRSDRVEGGGHRYLGLAFFCCYETFLGYELINHFRYIFVAPDCFECITIFEILVQMCLALGLMEALYNKEKYIPSNNSLSYYTWSIVGATSLSLAFHHVMEEIILTQIEICVRKRILRNLEYPIQSWAEYVPKLFKKRVKCFQYDAFHEQADFIIHLLPVGPEFYFLSAFFCANKWHRLEVKDCSEEIITGESTNVTRKGMTRLRRANSMPSFTPLETLVTKQSLEIEGLRHKKASPSFKLTIIMSCIAVSVFTVGSISIFYVLMHQAEHMSAVITYIVQQFIFNIAILSIEILIFVTKLNGRGQSDPTHGGHHELDKLLLICPLLQLGILVTLRVLPNIIGIPFTVKGPLVGHLWTCIDIFLAFLLWGEAAFQAFFISQLHDTPKKLIRKDKWVKLSMLLLFLLNFGVWLSWTLHAKQISLHGRSMQIFGEITWIVIVFCTVPFVLFCFGHSAASFLDLYISMN
ncbi:uncharacterized protein LOC118434129 [Folsomia candida]|uniref:uncharacterized protein LOC118434129 n=1 Tax=Folsomia candida TaxID=158441 RepID=UPI001604ED4F|nr:uncharacterized protein LOC118434129 [Folsomia candida]